MPGRTTVAYQERLTPPWWWWLLGLGGTGLLVTPIGLGAPGALRPVLLAGPVLAVAAGLGWLGRVRVAVAVPPGGPGGDGDELQVDDARLPVRFIREVVPLDAAGRRALLGTGADPLAFVVQRPWIPGAVQVVLDDPADPTPYWLVSTRAPKRLAAALRPAGPGS
jgi:hypothetical protein